MPIRPDAAGKRAWDALVALATVGVSVGTPLRVTLALDRPGWLRGLDAAVTAIFLADMALRLLARAAGRQSPRADLPPVERAYLRGWFWVDLLAALPVEWLAEAAGGGAAFRFLPLLRLLRLGRLAQSQRRWARESALNPALVRMAALVFWILLSAHFVACAWLALGAGNAAGTHGAYAPDDPVRLYVRALYWTTTTLTTIGYGDIAPSDNAQTVFCMFVQLLGAGMYGFVIGAIANLIANIDVAKAQFRERMEQIETFMRYKGIPTETRDKVRDYYRYLWETRRGQDEFSVIGDFPPPLKVEVLLYLNRAMIEKVPFFRGASPDFVREIVLALKPVVFSPGEHVFRKGEVGHNMYFISRGSVEVTSEDGRTVFATLQEGDFFGEIALLLSQPRTASVRSVGYTDLYELDQDTFQHVLKRFPEFERHIGELARKRHEELTRSIVRPVPATPGEGPTPPPPPGR